MLCAAHQFNCCTCTNFSPALVQLIWSLLVVGELTRRLKRKAAPESNPQRFRSNAAATRIPATSQVILARSWAAAARSKRKTLETAVRRASYRSKQTRSACLSRLLEIWPCVRPLRMYIVHKVCGLDVSDGGPLLILESCTQVLFRQETISSADARMERNSLPLTCGIGMKINAGKPR